MPESEVYEGSLPFWPYKDSLASVVKLINKNAPQKGALLDMMCGTGYLLGEIAKKRPDLRLIGVDIDDRYVSFSRKTYPGVNIEKGDVLKWHPQSAFDVVICTGSLHHVPYDRQEKAVANISSLVKPDGFVIVSDSYVDDYSNEFERKNAAAKLGYEYLKETIQNKAPNPVVEWTIDIMWNDVLMKEFKTSLRKRLLIFEKYFAVVDTMKTWPAIESDYGDYISILRPR
ncbi:hypothetical protein A3F39_01890 [Candidatus Berkelbacteria bacterium RIFCSPHIGHO2_12_FULL_50_11]|nr:MAG: hypothetical protein A3F39_01890 [Candidatus Berkelbacteria bacterium RIFCSPHIGHO2_12_FULL_50_11]